MAAPSGAAAPTRLAGDDGSARTLVDTNISVDCMDADSPWQGWAIDQLQALSIRATLHVNVVVHTELLVPGPQVDTRDAMLDVDDTQRTPLPWACGGLAAAAFALYRNQGGLKSNPMPDFDIGAHAALANLRVLTRDASPY